MIISNTTVGNAKKHVMFLVYKPFVEEDDVNDPGDSREWRYIKKVLEKNDFSLLDDGCIHYIYGRKDVPSKMNTDEVRKNIIDAIKLQNVHTVITLGTNALDVLIGDKMGGRAGNARSTQKWHGWTIPDQDLKINICPVYEPFEILNRTVTEGMEFNDRRNAESHNEEAKVKKLFFSKEIKNALRVSSPYIHNYLSECSIITNEQEAIELLKTFRKSKTISFDYETTGIKPYADGHELICIGISDGNVSYGMPLFDSPEFRSNLRLLLTSKRVKKIAHNMKYEDTWTNVKLGHGVDGWDFDPMIASHILDNRGGISGLKFQSYAKLGVIGYDDSVSSYIKSSANDKKLYGANAFNQLKKIKNKYFNGLSEEERDSYDEKLKELDEKIEKKKKTIDNQLSKKTPKQSTIDNATNFIGRYEVEKESIIKEMNDNSLYEKTLLYCAMDAHLTFHLANLHKQSIHLHNLDRAYKLFHEGTLALAKIERKGIRIDTIQLQKNTQELEKQIMQLEESILNSKEAQKWDGEKQFNFNSSQQLGHLLFDILGYPSKKETAKDNKSTDIESLEFIIKKRKSPMLEAIMEIKKLKKIKDTFLHGIAKETVNGILHPSFNLTTVASYRSSSQDPNFQNLSKHDPIAAKYIRGVFIPREGSRIVELDYGQLEVRGNASLSQDPGLIADCCIDDSDMHRDTAMELFKLTLEEWEAFVKENKTMAKEWRQIAKNKIVFPQFYGAGVISCTENVWSNLTPEMLARLKKIGVKDKEGLQKHISKIIDNFWNVRFLTFKEWGEGMYENYVKTGKLPLPSGFLCTDIINNRQAGNYPAQGGCFHLLLWSLTRLTEWLEDNDMKSFIIGQIHDSIVFNMYDDEMDRIFVKAKEIMTKTILEYYPWVKVPLIVEADLYPLNGNWSKVEKSIEI